jgi:uncharacterized protein (TIGR02266 family)
MTRAKGFVPRADRIEINREFASVEAFINEYVSNISSSGVFIKSKDPLPVGTRVNLKFTVLMSEIETVEGVGEVVRLSERPRGMGVAFIHLTAASQGLLSKLLTRREPLRPAPAGTERPAKAAPRSAARAPERDTLDEPVLSPAAKVTTSMRAVRREPAAARPPAPPTPPRAGPPPPPPPRRSR